VRAAAAALVLAAAATPCHGGAWTQPAGKGQVIIKYEDVEANRGFDADGARVRLPAPRAERFASVFAEYGLAPRWTLRLKTDWQSGRDAFVDYEGRGPLEVGVAWQAWRTDRAAVAIYAGVADGGEGRNAGYAAPGAGGRDVEVRLAAGRSFGAVAGPLHPLAAEGGFVEVQLARRGREDLADETRMDLTVGVRPHRDWLLMSQVYAGAADGGPRWVNAETSVVREFGDWSVQLGWREAVAGRDTPAPRGPVVGLWRRF
jgi:hypothetical protein